MESFDIQVYDGLMDEEFPLESIQPKSDDELKEAAIATIEQVAEEANMQQMSYAAGLLPIQYYDRIVARDYARNFSCNSGSMNDHSSCHNSKYKFYSGNDCANFVSQCIREGGLEPDDYWKPYTSEWISVRYLTSHMEGNYCYASSNDLDAFAGSIINLLNRDGTNAGHVGLVDQNDTRTMTLCAHTACRKSVPFSWFSNRNFYVPRWDSYTALFWNVRLFSRWRCNFCWTGSTAIAMD